MDIMSEIEKLSKDINDTERLRENAKGQKKIYEEQLKQNETEFEKLGIKPEDAEKEITKLNTEIQKNIEAIRNMLPNDILAKSRERNG